MAINAVGRTTIQGATTVGGFNPATLFSAGEQGVWYDPSDLSTLFQDSAGTIPVTALEQPVGRMLDKSGRGNTATQATSANRPVVSARVNLATYSQSLATTSAWAIGSASLTLTNNSAPDPYGGNNATLVVETTVNNLHFIEQTVTSVTANLSYTISCFFKKGTRRYVCLLHSTSSTNYCGAVFDLDAATATAAANSAGFSASNPQITAVGNGWYRCSVNITQPGTTVYIDIGFRSTAYSSGFLLESYAGSTSENGYWFGVDLRPTNQGVGLPVYQRVGAAVAGASTTVGNADYDANGFPVYLSFDGSDDSLATGNINFTSTDKMLVSLGIRNLIGSVPRISCSFNTYNTDGSWAFYTRDTYDGQYNFLNRGTVLVQASLSSGYEIAPKTLITTGYGDVSAPTTNLRLNGVARVTNTSTLGTATYGNAPLYIGRNTNNVMFTGNLYGLIVRGASSTSNQITGAENWLNQKTAAY